MVPTARWEASKIKLQESMLTAGSLTIADIIDKAQKKSKEAIRESHLVYQDSGEVLDPPIRTSEGAIKRTDLHGKAWFQTVVKTLHKTYGAGLDDQANPESGRLLNAVSRVYREERISKWTMVLGYAARPDLDRATQYNARVLFREVPVTPEMRGMKSAYFDENLVIREQMIWWNWDEKRWETGSVIGRSDGTSMRFGLNGVPASGWRKAIPAGSGYWADFEFGVEGAQVPAGMIPAEGQNLVQLTIGRHGFDATRVGRRADFAIPAYLYLTQGAELVAKAIRGEGGRQSKNKYRAQVRGLLGVGS